MKDTEELNVVYVRFDKNLDYKEVVNSFPIKKFLETVFGDFPHMVTPKNFEFDREQLGQFAQDETTVPEPIEFEVSDFDDTLEDIKSMDEDTLIHEYPAWYSAWEVETNSGETDYSFRFWLNEQFEEQKRLAEEIEEDEA